VLPFLIGAEINFSERMREIRHGSDGIHSRPRETARFPCTRTWKIPCARNNHYSRQIGCVIEQERDFRPGESDTRLASCNAARRRRAHLGIRPPSPLLPRGYPATRLPTYPPAISYVRPCRKASVHGLQSGY